MNDRQENYISMNNKVEIVAEKYKEIWKENEAMKKTVTGIKAVNVKIADAAERQIYDNSTFVKEKRKFRKLTTTQAIIICGIIKSYAAAVDDQDLFDNVDYNKSKMNKIRDTLFITLINFLIHKSTDLLDTLKDYGMTQKLIDALGKEADGYITAVAKPQAAIAAKAEATNELKILFKELRRLFDENLDNNMLFYLTSHTKFYNEYILAREIYDTGHFAIPLYGKAVDEETKLPLPNITVSAKFKAGTDIATTVKTTSAKGNYQFKKLEPGIYIITFEKHTYDTITKEVEIIKNKGLRLDVAIRKTE